MWGSKQGGVVFDFAKLSVENGVEQFRSQLITNWKSQRFIFTKVDDLE